MQISRITPYLLPSLALKVSTRLPSLNHVFQTSVCRSFSCCGPSKKKSCCGPKISKPLNFTDQLNEVVETKFPVHPFVDKVLRNNVKEVMKGYYAMSQAFPYLQAGAYKGLILDCIMHNKEVTPDIEESFAVGSFLSFDETGGNYLLRTEGIQALPKILNTQDLFHASLLRKDMETIFGEKLSPNFRFPTDGYLLNLLKGLGSSTRLERCATMVAFEMHAGQMIEALWNSLHTLFPEHDKNSLEYFKVHVGGDDPQEEYHKMVTQKMVDSAIAYGKSELFLQVFEEKYRKNIAWCEDLCDMNTPNE